MLGLFKPLELEHRCMVDRYLRKYPPKNSELSFVNLWVWSMCLPAYVYEEDKVLYLLRKGHDSFFGFVPLGSKPLTKRVARLLELMEAFEMEGRMERVCEPEALELAKEGFLVHEDRDQFDYVYSCHSLAELGGRKLHRKRNHIKKCLKSHQCEYVPFTSSLLPAAQGFLEEWCKLRNCADDSDLMCEQRAIRFLLYDYDKFHVMGGAVRVDGELAALTFGEKLNLDTAVIHFEKAHPEVDGLYPLVNQWFCQNALKDFKWVNREQDLGIPGLRKAKESYYPAKMIKKYVVTAGK